LSDFAINASISTDINADFPALRNDIENQYGCFPDETNPWGALYTTTIIQTSNPTLGTTTNNYVSTSRQTIAKSPLDALYQINQAGGIQEMNDLGPNDTAMNQFYWASFS